MFGPAYWNDLCDSNVLFWLFHILNLLFWSLVLGRQLFYLLKTRIWREWLGENKSQLNLFVLICLLFFLHKGVHVFYPNACFPTYMFPDLHVSRTTSILIYTYPGQVRQYFSHPTSFSRISNAHKWCKNTVVLGQEINVQETCIGEKDVVPIGVLS